MSIFVSGCFSLSSSSFKRVGPSPGLSFAAWLARCRAAKGRTSGARGHPRGWARQAFKISSGLLAACRCSSCICLASMRSSSLLSFCDSLSAILALILHPLINVTTFAAGSPGVARRPLTSSQRPQFPAVDLGGPKGVGPGQAAHLSICSLSSLILPLSLLPPPDGGACGGDPELKDETKLLMISGI